MSKKVLSRFFYERPTLEVAKELLGKLLVRMWDGKRISGIIIETEAYIGEDDPACHASVGKTPRNCIMYGQAGFAYVYFIYGMYFCLNVVTERYGFPAAVLIRALEPVEGIEWMKKWRNKDKLSELTSGPGKLTQALFITKELNGVDLCDANGILFIEEFDSKIGKDFIATPRIGIDKGKDKLWRFCCRNNPFVSTL